jgi:hypothetical protein
MFLTTAGNVLIPAYLALVEKGYSVRREGTGDQERWHAEKADRHFLAEDPLYLLGLVALYETRGEDWRATDEQIDGFLDRHGT